VSQHPVKYHFFSTVSPREYIDSSSADATPYEKITLIKNNKR